MIMRCLAATAIASSLLVFATGAAAESPNDKVQVPDSKICTKPLRDGRCKRKDLKDEPKGELKLADYVGVSANETYAQSAPNGTAYGQVRVSVTDSQALAQALTKKNGWLRTFMPQARGVVISVAASANSAGQAFDVLPRTPVIALDVPLPASGQNARSLATVNEVRSGWMRLDAGVQYNFTLTVDTVSEQKFAGLDNVLSRIASIYTTVTGDQLLGSMSNAALKTAATSADQLITDIVDPDGRDKRTLSGGYLITPTNGGTRALVFDIRDERDGNPIATVRVELLFTSTLIQPTAVTDPAQIKLAAVNPGAVLKNYRMTTEAAAAKTLGARAEYALLLQQVQAVGATPGTITKQCGEFQNTASSWGLTTLDAALLNYEALDDANRQNADNATVLKNLERQRCIRDADWATLKQLDRQPPPAAALGRNLLTVPDLTSLGSYFIKTGSSPSLAHRFAAEVAINGVASDLPFQGSFFSGLNDAFDTVRSLSPSRFCCIGGAAAEGRVQLALDLAQSGATAPQPVVAELWTSPGDSLVAELRLRAPNAAELTLISSKWPKHTVATLAPTQGGRQ